MSILRALDGAGASLALPLVAVLSLGASSAEAAPTPAPVQQTKAAPTKPATAPAAKPVAPPPSKPVPSITLAEPKGGTADVMTISNASGTTTISNATMTTNAAGTTTISNATGKTMSTSAPASASASPKTTTHAATTNAAMTTSATGSAAPPRTSGRSFIIGMKAGDVNSVRMIELVVVGDPENPKVAQSCELRVGPMGKPADQVLTFKVDAGIDTVLASADVVDLNFDGLRDFWVMREAGAKWSRYEAFVWDGRTGRFVKDAFAKEISQLDNPEYDEASKSFVSSSMGPSEPYRTVRKVQGGHTVVVESCAFHNGKDTNQDDQNEGLLVTQKVVGNALKTTQKQISVKLTENPCTAAAMQAGATVTPIATVIPTATTRR